MKHYRQLHQFLRTPTIRLTAIHLAIIMTLSISFSIVFYHTSDQQFARPAPRFNQSVPGHTNNSDRVSAERFNDEIRDSIDEYIAQTRHALLIRLLWLNIGALLTGAAISYMLARWSLRPIETTMDAQTQFVSDVSHELRTPLTVLQTTNEVALLRQKLPSAEARKLISHNVEEVKRLRDLTNTLLDLLKNIDTAIMLQPVSLQDAVSDALSGIVSIAQAKEIVVEDTVPHVYAVSNRELLIRVVVILLDNAVKYSDTGARIVISAHQSDHKLLLNIIDQGIGIPRDDLPHIFRRFYRADKSRSAGLDSQGYGLGLSIAEKISRQIDAKIVVSSIEGQGSTFTIELPLADQTV